MARLLESDKVSISASDISLDSLEARKSFMERIRERRVRQFVGAYLAGGFAVLGGLGLLLEQVEAIPAVSFELLLATFLWGLPGIAVLAWHHGKPGMQTLRMTEIWIHLTLVFLWIITCAFILRFQGYL